MSDSEVLKTEAYSLNRPIAGILLTHGHPDHVAGTLNVAPNGDVPIYASESVRKPMEDTEARFERIMIARYLDYGCQFMVGLAVKVLGILRK